MSKGKGREDVHICIHVLFPLYPLRPNIWGSVTDGLLFASHHSNVLPAPAPMSINGRHVPKHIQHTKRTLWLEEMDCAQDWQLTLWMCQSPEALCFYRCPRLQEQRRLICLCVWYKHTNIPFLHLAQRYENSLNKMYKTVGLLHWGDFFSISLQHVLWKR